LDILLGLIHKYEIHCINNQTVNAAEKLTAAVLEINSLTPVS